MAEKKCSKCGDLKPLDKFYFLKSGKEARRSECITCSQAACRQYRAKNIEKIKAIDKAYYEKNKDRWKEYEIKRRQSPDFRRKISETQKRWYLRNKEQKNVWTRNRRAKIKGLMGTHTKQDVLNLLRLQKSLCIYCRIDIGKSFHVDHIMPVSAGGHNDVSNLQLLCKTCNLKKNNKHPQQFAEEIGLLI